MSRKRIGGKEPYARLYASAHSHPRHLQAGLAAEGLWKRAMAYCADHMTDGFIPAKWFENQAPKKVIASGANAGLWEKVETSYLIHDFLDHNRSREQVEENRARERAKKAGNTAGIPLGNGAGKTQSHTAGNTAGIPRDSVTQLHSRTQ